MGENIEYELENLNVETMSQSDFMELRKIANIYNTYDRLYAFLKKCKKDLITDDSINNIIEKLEKTLEMKLGSNAVDCARSLKYSTHKATVLDLAIKLTTHEQQLKTIKENLNELKALYDTLQSPLYLLKCYTPHIVLPQNKQSGYNYWTDHSKYRVNTNFGTCELCSESQYESAKDNYKRFVVDIARYSVNEEIVAKKFFVINVAGLIIKNQPSGSKSVGNYVIQYEDESDKADKYESYNEKNNKKKDKC